MIRQLRELARSESSGLKDETLDPDSDLDAGFQFLAPGKDDDFFSSCEVVMSLINYYYSICDLPVCFGS